MYQHWHQAKGCMDKQATKIALLDLRAIVIDANSKDIKLMHVLIESHELMTKEPLTLEEEVEEEDVEVKANSIPRRLPKLQQT
jgi:hypothetical protein